LYDVIIIGAGPAGISAAIQLKRFGKNILVIEKNVIGGLVKNANLIENYLGFPDGITGVRFVELMKEQLNNFNIEIIFDTAISIKYDNHFTVKTLLNEFNSEILIAASGTIPKNIKEEISIQAQELIYYEVYDLLKSHSENICIIGAGDAAFDYALNLTKKKNNVTILNRGTEIKSLKKLQNEVFLNPLICYKNNYCINSIDVQNEKLCIKSNNEFLLFDKLIIAVGREPDCSFIPEEILKNPRFFKIGDLVNNNLRQTALAAGDGVKVAQIIEQNFYTNRNVEE